MRWNHRKWLLRQEAEKVLASWRRFVGADWKRRKHEFSMPYRESNVHREEPHLKSYLLGFRPRLGEQAGLRREEECT